MFLCFIEIFVLFETTFPSFIVKSKKYSIQISDVPLKEFFPLYEEIYFFTPLVKIWLSMITSEINFHLTPLLLLLFVYLFIYFYLVLEQTRLSVLGQKQSHFHYSAFSRSILSCFIINVVFRVHLTHVKNMCV